MNYENSDMLFALIFNNVEKYPTINDVAAKLGLKNQTVRNKAVELRKRHHTDADTAPELIQRTGGTPLSEDDDKFIADFTKEQCIEELQRIALLDPDRALSRNYFRVHSNISEATWNRYFGTFTEFKRQAGLMLTRPQHQLERQIAKHASVKHYRDMNEERTNWGDKYVKDNAGRFKTILTCSDLHDEEIDPFYLRVLIDTVARLQPDVVSFVGDVLDLPEFGKYGVDPREFNPVKRIKFAHDEIFRPIRNASPKSQIDFIEGNHEARLLRHLCDASPALKVLLSDLHGMTVSKLLGLDEFEINYHAKADLSAWTERDFKNELRHNHKIYYNTVMCNHFPDARNLNMPGVNGHHHSHHVWPMFNPMFGAYEWHQMGSGHRRDASYCNGEKWHMGFDIIHVDTKTNATVHEYVVISDFACVGGKFYYREAKEVVAGGLVLK